MKTIKWGEPLTTEELEDLRNGGVYTVLYGNTPISEITMDDKQTIQEVELCCM